MCANYEALLFYIVLRKLSDDSFVPFLTRRNHKDFLGKDLKCIYIFLWLIMSGNQKFSLILEQFQNGPGIDGDFRSIFIAVFEIELENGAFL